MWLDPQEESPEKLLPLLRPSEENILTMYPVFKYGHGTVELEAEYDLRITQSLVLQPRAEVGFAFQDIPEHNLGAGMTEVQLDLRLRYEIKREFAPYFGVRSRFLVGETANIAEAREEDTEQLFFLAGFRCAF